jgi:hypothetical protein
VSVTISLYLGNDLVSRVVKMTSAAYAINPKRLVFLWVCEKATLTLRHTIIALRGDGVVVVPFGFQLKTCIWPPRMHIPGWFIYVYVKKVSDAKERCASAPNPGRDVSSRQRNLLDGEWTSDGAQGLGGNTYLRDMSTSTFRRRPEARLLPSRGGGAINPITMTTDGRSLLCRRVFDRPLVCL